MGALCRDVVGAGGEADSNILAVGNCGVALAFAWPKLTNISCCCVEAGGGCKAGGRGVGGAGHCPDRDAASITKVSSAFVGCAS